MQEIGLYPIRNETLSLRERMRLIAQAGFQYVCCGSMEELLHKGGDGFLACAQREGLPVDNVHLTGGQTNAMWLPGTPGDEVAARYCLEMRQAAAAGVSTGVAHVTWGLDAPPQDFTCGLERFKRLADEADRLGFTIAFENSVSAPHLCAVLDALSAPCVRFCFDSGHWNAFAKESDFPARFGARLRVTHLQDNDGRRDLHLIPFDGCTPYVSVAKVLSNTNRLTFEVAGAVEKNCPGQSAEQIRAALGGLAIARNDALLKIWDGGFSVYREMSYEAFLRRLMDAGQRMRMLIVSGKDEHV